MIGALFVMYLLGYSLNLLTLLSMVLAIGLVVDDAIIVVENVHRHIEEGMERMQAALQGARELAIPIIAMTTTLLAVYAPIGFMGGLTGALFVEFAFTLTGAVLISGVIALTLSPMLSSRVLRRHGQEGRFEQRVEKVFTWLSDGYARLLHGVHNARWLMILVGLAILASNYLMFVNSKNELAPDEDQGILFVNATGPRTATLEYLEAYGQQIQSIYESFPEYNESFYILGRTPGQIFGGFKMIPAEERERLEQLKVTICTDDPVTGLVIERGRCLGVTSRSGQHLADNVIICAGAWSGQLLRPLGINPHIYPMRGYSVTL